MNTQIYKKLNSTDTINKSIPKIIEAFTIFYGEEERERITEKFNNILIIGYINPKKIEQLLKEDKKRKSDELIIEFLNRIGIKKEEHSKYKNIFFDNITLDTPSKHPINKYIQYRNGNKSEKCKIEAYEFLKQLYPKLKLQDLNRIFSPINKKELNKILERYKDILIEYNKYLETFKEQEEYINKCNKLKKELEKKYNSILIDEFKYLFTEEELKQIKENNNTGQPINSANKKSENYFSKNLNNVTLIDSFNIENEEVLNGNQSWRIHSILKDRIKFFKNLGIDLGNIYEEYLANEDVKKMLPLLKDLAEKIKSRRKDLYTKMMNEYYTSLEEYQININRIQNANLLDKEHGYDANTYEMCSTFVSPNIKNTENGIINFPILCFCITGRESYLDTSLIHELNHVYELTLQNVEGTKYSVTCGWERITGEYNNQVADTVSLEERKTKREYELFNEIINELISQEITEILFSLDGYVFNTKENAKIENGTNYEETLFLVRGFYNKYKKEIIASRRNGDINIIYETVGKENFKSLNKLFYEFHEILQETSIYGLKNTLNKNKETEQTKKYYEIIKKRDAILKAMEEHTQNKKLSK